MVSNWCALSPRLGWKRYIASVRFSILSCTIPQILPGVYVNCKCEISECVSSEVTFELQLITRLYAQVPYNWCSWTWCILALSVAVFEDDLSVTQVMRGGYLRRERKWRIPGTREINAHIKKKKVFKKGKDGGANKVGQNKTRKNSIKRNIEQAELEIMI
jgi:hypothetical protein